MEGLNQTFPVFFRSYIWEKRLKGVLVLITKLHGAPQRLIVKEQLSEGVGAIATRYVQCMVCIS